MKYRTRLYIAFISIAVASSIIALAIIYRQYHKLVIQDFKTKVLAAATTAASLLDTNALSHIRKSGDENTNDYRIIMKQLKQVRDQNIAANFNIAYIYTLMPDPNDSSKLVYGVDAEENKKEIYPIGYPYNLIDAPDIIKHLHQPWGSSNFIFDEYGAWFSAYAPVFDAQGKYIATVAIYLNAREVYNELYQLRTYGFYALLIAIFLAVCAAYFLSRIVTRSLAYLCESVKEIGDGNLKAIASSKSNDEFNDLAIAINQMAQGLQEKERLKVGFAKYVSQHILEKILESETSIKFGGERRKITVLFADIRKFTTLSEKLPPEEVVSLLNAYLEKMIEVIFDNGGTLDKFLGDGIMAEFGAPLEDALQEKNAVKTAIKMQEEMFKLRERLTQEGKPSIEIGIGIHTGLAIVGNIGSEKRTEYTAIGDTVNIASRLEQATKILNTPILISETTYEATKDQFPYIYLGPLLLAGRTDKITVYTLSDTKEPKKP